MTSSPRKDIHNSDVPVLCRSCDARHKGLCGALSPEQLLQLSRKTRRDTLQPGQTFVHGEGDDESCANVLKGVVKSSMIMADGRQQIVGLRFAPDFIGRTREQSDANLETEAATEVQICSFPRKSIVELLDLNPELEKKLHKQVAKELDEAREWMLTLGRKTAAERVASFLLLLAQHIDPESQDEAKNITFDLPLTRSDIADFLGLTTETVSRQLTKLRKNGIVVIDNNRHVEVLAYDALESIARGE